MNFIKLLHFTSIVILACPISWAYDSTAASKQREDFIKKLPLRVLCVPEVSGGVKINDTGKWESTRFKINDEDKFTAKIGKPSDFDEEQKSQCEYKIKEIHSPHSPTICISQKYFAANREHNTFIIACELLHSTSIQLKCGDELILEPNGPYLSATFSVGLSFGQASVQKGTCMTIN